MKSFYLFAIMCLFSFTTIGCGGTPESDPEDDAQRATQETDPEYEKEMMGGGEAGEAAE